MTEVLRAADALQAFRRARGWRFCIIGGIAVLRWGEPRETIDADLTLLTGFGGEEPYVRALLGQFESRVPEGMQFAFTNRVLLLQSASGVGLDLSLGGLGRFWLLASLLLSHRAQAMLLRLASPEAKIGSSKSRSYFCTDPKDSRTSGVY